MPNKPYAKEWLIFSLKNLQTAELLWKANHYEDIIGVELQQALEKMLKAIFASNNVQIPKVHDLLKLYYTIEDAVDLSDEEIVLLRIATDYYKEDRYPNSNYALPPREEIETILDFVRRLFDRVCMILDISKAELV